MAYRSGTSAADDGLHAGGVGFVLAAGEGEDAGAAVLDGDGGVEEGGDGVGHREEVTGRETAERLVVGDPDVAFGEHHADEGGELRPRGAPAQADQSHAALPDRRPHLRGQGDRGPDHETHRVVGTE